MRPESPALAPEAGYPLACSECQGQYFRQIVIVSAAVAGFRVRLPGLGLFLKRPGPGRLRDWHSTVTVTQPRYVDSELPNNPPSSVQPLSLFL
jgi:hypothetical protein